MASKTTRRRFLATGLAAAGAAAAGGAMGAQTVQKETAPAKPTAPPAANDKDKADGAAAPTKMPERALGRTGVVVPVFGLGGAGQTPLSRDNAEAEADALLQRALELGIRYFDTAASYGPSEDYMGRVLPPHRARIFLASKTDKRDRDGAWRQLERSLKRLNTDRLDLWQMHHVSFMHEVDEMLGPKGAVRALEEAKAQKLVRWGGISGHHEPDVIAQALRRYDFDAALLSINAADKHHPRPFISSVLPVARQKNVGVIAMKIPAYGRLFSSGALDSMSQAMGYTLSQPGVHCCIIAAENPAQLESNVGAARAFVPLSPAELEAIERRTAATWKENSFFREWT